MSDSSAVLRSLLEHPEPEARRLAVRQIATAGSDAPELLLVALGDEDWRVRKEAAAIAPILDGRETVVAALLLGIEKTADIGRRNAVVEALVAIGTDSVAATIEALDSKDSEVRKLVVEVLGGVPDPRGTVALSSALADEDPNVQSAAAEALGSAAVAGEDSRERAIHALSGALTSPDVLVRMAALGSLARLGAELPFEAYESSAEDPLLRRYAIAAASRSRDRAAMRALARAAGDPSSTIAREALVGLGEALASDPLDSDLQAFALAELERCPEALQFARRAARGELHDARARGGALTILGLLKDPGDVPDIASALEDDEVAERAYVALNSFGGRAVEPLLAVARMSHPSILAKVLALVTSIIGSGSGDPKAELLRTALRDGLSNRSPDVVVSALEGLAAVGDESDLPRIAPFFRDSGARIPTAARASIARLAARHVASGRELLTSLSATADDRALACVLVDAIGSVQPLETHELQVLMHALEHDAPSVRASAVEALSRLADTKAADAAVFALADENQGVQLAAVRALGTLKQAGPLAELLTRTSDPALVSSALRALGEASPNRALASARALVVHPDPAIASAAIDAIGQLSGAWREGGSTPRLDPASEDALFSALEHHDTEVVKLALSLVGAEPGARAIARLGLCLDHPSWEVRRYAAELLGNDGRPGARSLLHERYAREKDQLVRAAIASTLSLRPPETPRASQFGEAAPEMDEEG